MVNYMEELSVTEADNLKKTIAALFTSSVDSVKLSNNANALLVGILCLCDVA